MNTVEMTKAIFDFAKGKQALCGFVDIAGRDDLWGNFVYHYNFGTINGATWEIFDDLNNKIPDKEFDAMIKFYLFVNAPQDDMQFVKVGANLAQVIIYTTSSEFMNSEQNKFDIFDEKYLNKE